MIEKKYVLNTILAAVLCAVLLAAVLLRTFVPAIILPELNLPNMVLISLIALLIEHCAGSCVNRCYICIPVFSALTFGLLPWAAGIYAPVEALKLGALGGAVFTVVTWLFSSMQERLASGPAAKVAPVICAVCMFCAAQCLTGILL